MTWRIHHGDALEVLRTLPGGSIDAIVTDPPYPEIDRPYGRMTESEWLDMMKHVALEMRRVLKPDGSAVCILQPNSESVGRMRTWLWDFMAWAGREWNIVQDAWWWNHTAPPTVHCHASRGLMRPSVKACVWLGAPGCYRNQAAVLWTPSESMRDADLSDRALRHYPSGLTVRNGRIAETVLARGGVTPFNLLPIPNSDSVSSGGAHGHGAATPAPLCAWWIKYVSRPGELVLDPFTGSGTTGVVATRLGRRFVGIERDPDYVRTATARIIADAPLWNTPEEATP